MPIERWAKYLKYIVTDMKKDSDSHTFEDLAKEGLIDMV